MSVCVCVCMSVCVCVWIDKLMFTAICIKVNNQFYHMNSVRVLTVKSAASGDRVQCSFLSDRSLSKHHSDRSLSKHHSDRSLSKHHSDRSLSKHHFHTQVNGSNFTLFCICRGLCNKRSVWFLFWNLATIRP